MLKQYYYIHKSSFWLFVCVCLFVCVVSFSLTIYCWFLILSLFSISMWPLINMSCY